MPHGADAFLVAITTEFRRYRSIAESSLAQVSDEGLNRVPEMNGNSMAMLVRHITGNLTSRFTEFPSTDGEKSWRDRDSEFEERAYSRDEVQAMWSRAWRLLEQTLDGLSEGDLQRSVRIRNQELTVPEALIRSVAHLSYHVGQMVLLARSEREGAWEWISIPKGQSKAYNRNPTKERGT